MQTCCASRILTGVNLALLVLILCACSGGASAPAYRVKVYDPPASAGLKGHQKPYSVNGKRYEPLRESNGFVEEGLASWYGPDFHGKPTSCGEIYDMHALTAAHKILPLGVSVRVTNQNNGKSVVVRVNDRGPFVGNRIIDLSYAAAQELDIVAAGTAPVRIEALGFQQGDGYAPPANYNTGPFTVQVASFKDQENARRLSTQLKKQYGTSTIQSGWVKENLFHRVRVGSYPTLAAASQAQQSFAQAGFPNGLVVAER